MDDNLNVKLTDFGFATELDDDEEMYGAWVVYVRAFVHCICVISVVFVIIN